MISLLSQNKRAALIDEAQVFVQNDNAFCRSIWRVSCENRPYTVEEFEGIIQCVHDIFVEVFSETFIFAICSKAEFIITETCLHVKIQGDGHPIRSSLNLKTSYLKSLTAKLAFITMSDRTIKSFPSISIHTSPCKIPLNALKTSCRRELTEAG